MSSTRPIMVAGPMERNSNPRSNGSVVALGGGPAGGAGARPWAHKEPVMNRLAAATSDTLTRIVDYFSLINY